MAAAVAAPLSPSTSPRLPSPPPFPEVQIGPKSPGMGPTGPPPSSTPSDPQPPSGPLRRIRPGTKSADMNSGPPLIPLTDLDTPFQLQEHLSALYHHHTTTQNTSTSNSSSPATTQPITHATAKALATPPPKTDPHLWLYELCRFLVTRANDLLVAFFADTPPCSSSTCPEMRASEWQYLCAVHDPPKSCCAIDYCCHTLDWAANMLTSQKQFPSRLSLNVGGGGGAGGAAAAAASAGAGGIEQQSLRHLTNIMRRVYRIFAHAWFQHRGMFWEVEGRTGLYVFFKTVCDVHGLIEQANYTVPAEAEGIVTSGSSRTGDNGGDVKEEMSKKEERISIVQKREQGAGQQQQKQQGEQGQRPLSGEGQSQNGGDASEDSTTVSTGATTRRHKHTPSTGVAVAPIAEGEDEEENSEEGKKAKSNVDEKAPNDTTSDGKAQDMQQAPSENTPHIPQRVPTVVLAPTERTEASTKSPVPDIAKQDPGKEEPSVEEVKLDQPELESAPEIDMEPKPGIAEHEPTVKDPDEPGIEPDDGLEKLTEKSKQLDKEVEEAKGAEEENREVDGQS